jgi:hypothetical protein
MSFLFHKFIYFSCLIDGLSWGMSIFLTKKYHLFITMNFMEIYLYILVPLMELICLYNVFMLLFCCFYSYHVNKFCWSWIKFHTFIHCWFLYGCLKNPSYQVSFHLAKGLQRRRLKCEKLTDDKWWQKLTLPLARWAKVKWTVTW